MRTTHLASDQHRKVLSNQPQIQLTPEQELAAISSFLASLPANVIPPTVDPSRPIDPQLVLDFDTRSSRASEEVEVMVEDVWSRNPVMLYSKLYSPISREIKATLLSMNLHPAPTIMDVDIRDDAEVLKPMLLRLTASSDLPILLVGGQPIGSITVIRDMIESGELQRRIYEAGAVSVEKKKKHKK
jgi:glutaredoxin-related protein